MLEIDLDTPGLRKALYCPADGPPFMADDEEVDRTITRFDALEQRWVSDREEIAFETAVLEVMAYSGLGGEEARQALLKSTAHTGQESPFEMDDPEPVYVHAYPLVEVRPNEAQAKQRALELSKLLECGTAEVTGPLGGLIAVYKDGALCSLQTGEQLTPAV